MIIEIMHNRVANMFLRSTGPKDTEPTEPEDVGDLFAFERFLEEQLRTESAQRRLVLIRRESDSTEAGANSQLQVAAQEELDAEEVATERDPSDAGSESDKENEPVPTPEESQSDA